VAKSQEPYAGKEFSITVDRIEPEAYFSFRWHPFAVDPNVDYSSEPMTLVEFVLEEVSEGVRLTIRESGFENLTEERRMTSFPMEEQGWTAQARLIEMFVSR
jgi:hypothetical protein